MTEYNTGKMQEYCHTLDLFRYASEMSIRDWIKNPNPGTQHVQYKKKIIWQGCFFFLPLVFYTCNVLD